MGRNVDDIIAALPKARRDWIEAKAARMAREMIEQSGWSETVGGQRFQSLILEKPHGQGLSGRCLK